MAIFCPVCAWRPGPRARWVCRPGCGLLWNTFDTRGICPRCYKVWRYTRCPSCKDMSLHEAWYHDDLDEQASEDATTIRSEPVLIPV